MATHRGAAILAAMAAVVCLSMDTGKAGTFVDRPYDLNLRIDCPQQDIRLGDEILITFTITSKDPNVFAYQTRKYHLGMSRAEYDGYDLVARYPDGKPVPDPGENELPIIPGGFGWEIRHIATGQSFTTSVPLNRWARITKPGRYIVAGLYEYHFQDNSMKAPTGTRPTKRIRVTATPIEIEVKPRNVREMGQYIEDLTSRLKSLDGKDSHRARDEREHLLAQLAYTCDKRIGPTMLDTLYKEHLGNEHTAAYIAFCCYLPHSDDVRGAVLATIRARGLANYMVASIVKPIGCSEVDAAEIIRSGLASKDPDVVQAAIVAMYEYPADEHMPRLITIALDPSSVSPGLSPGAAIWALAHHRTDEGVAVLRKLLNDPDPDIRKSTSKAIYTAYFERPYYPQQVDQAYTEALVSIATDPNHIRRYSAVEEIARTRTSEGVKVVQRLLVDPNVEIALADADLGIRTIRDLLRNEDPDVREFTREALKIVYHEYPGRPLRPDDFPSEYQEVMDGRRKALEKWLKD